jgi:6-phosphogluconolactonase
VLIAVYLTKRGILPMKIEVLADAEAVARKAAEVIAAEVRSAVAIRGQCVLAVSGGRTPWIMLRRLSDFDMPWDKLHVVQVDERIAPSNDSDRNLTHLRERLLGHVPLPADRIHAMPVEASDLEAAAVQYATSLRTIAGSPPVIDVVHLGLGSDGHTASLVPGDPVLNVVDADVALTGVYQGRRRMTLTYPILDRARCIIWVVTGSEKSAALVRLRDGDRSIPAGMVRRDHAMMLADRAAAEGLQQRQA